MLGDLNRVNLSRTLPLVEDASDFCHLQMAHTGSDGGVILR